MTPEVELRAVTDHFQMAGVFADACRHGSGHIHDTYRVTFDEPRGRAEMLLQRINDRVFIDPPALMENIQRVTDHLRARHEDLPDRDRRALSIIPTCDGSLLYHDKSGGWWRAYRFIGNAHSRDVLAHPGQAFEAGKAFGHFQAQLADLPPPRLHDTIPDFHHTPKRFAALQRAIERDPLNRAVRVRREIEFALAREPATRLLLEGGLPERVTHNDTKLNNVLLDDDTGEALCVIDLDTVMPGLVAYDFGDLVRTSVSPALEDEPDLSKVEVRIPVFEALLRGYLETAGGFLTPPERGHLAVSGKVITLEMGLRFLTDFLEGDIYYKTERQGHNLDRCLTQFKLVESLEAQEDALQKLVDSVSSS